MALSLRGSRAAEPSEGLLQFAIIADLYDAHSNPNGYVSLGIAENTLMHDTFSQHISANLKLPNHAFTYGDGPTGSKRLKAALVSFFAKYFAPARELHPSHLAITNGCTSAIEQLAWMLLNPGDGILLGRPFYGTFIPDLTLRTGAHVVPVSFDRTDPFGLQAVEKYENALINAQRLGQRVKALVLCHPHNPLGKCYPRSTLIALMRLCEKYQIHFISDEIYALSVFKNQEENSNATTEAGFDSVLSFELEGIINPALAHVIWGFSKDFGSNGIRLGVIISQQNPELMAAMVATGLYSSVSSISDHAAANILEDDAWTDHYIHQNRQKLAEHYAVVTQWAEKNQIEHSKGVTAAFFLWVNLGQYYRSRHGTDISWNTDDIIMSALLERKVFLAAGKQFGSEDPGWFRIVFSNKRKLLEEGLCRVMEALNAAPISSPTSWRDIKAKL